MFSITTSAFPRISLKTIAWATVVSLLLSTACTTSRYVVVNANDVDFRDNVRVLTLKDGSTVEFPRNTGIYDKTCECFRSINGFNISVPVDSVDNANVYRSAMNDSAPIVILGFVTAGLLLLALIPSMESPVSFKQRPQR